MTDGNKSPDQSKPQATPPLTGSARSASVPGRKKSVLQTIGQRGSNRRRRKPPAWALKVVQSVVTLKYFFKQKLPGSVKRRRRELFTAVASFLIHLLVVFSLTLWMLPRESRDSVLAIISGQVEDVIQEEPIEVVNIVQPEEMTDLNVDSTIKQMVAELDKGMDRDQFNSPEDTELRMPVDELEDKGDISVLKGNFGGRSEAGRRAAVKRYGGTVESEKSVNLGLTWLQKVQRKDGSWSFGAVGGAGQPGSMQAADMGATSMALLCMLGGGHTRETEGEFQETVARGLEWMMKNAVRTPAGADLRGRIQGNSGMYVHGLATICLGEASALEPRDRDLRRVTLEAVRFLERTQGSDGGWRYQPREVPGDTSVVGWQVMALQSAKAGGIQVNASTFSDVKKFLNSVQTRDGARYGYTSPADNRPATTAVGLLCRMYLGWKREKPELKAGVEYLAKTGPSRDNMYYNYYATQVMHHWDGELWDKWNHVMRDQLVATQVKDGAGAGSWNVTDPHGSAGGRIYQTALSLLTLEVYYRHLPIYRRFDDDAKAVSVTKP